MQPETCRLLETYIKASSARQSLAAGQAGAGTLEMSTSNVGVGRCGLLQHSLMGGSCFRPPFPEKNWSKTPSFSYVGGLVAGGKILIPSFPLEGFSDRLL